MAGSIQAAQAVADIRAGMAVGEDPEFDSLMRSGDRNARGGSSEGGGEGFGDDENGGQGGDSGNGGRGQQPRQPAPVMSPPDPGADPLTDLRGSSGYAPAPPLPVGFAEFPVASRGGRSRTTRRGLGGTGMAVTGVQQTGVLRVETGTPATNAGNNWHAEREWQVGPRVQGAIDFAGFMAPRRAGGALDGIHPDPLERFANAGKRRRDALDILFERFEGMCGAKQASSSVPIGSGMHIPVLTAASGLQTGDPSRN